MPSLPARLHNGNKEREMASFSFNTADAPPAQSFDLVPEGVYHAVALSSEVKETKTGGEMVVYKMQITDGPHANRILWARFNVRNANPKAQEIGLGQLSGFCRSVGVAELTDTDDLCGKPVAMRVKIRPARDGYEAQNEVAGFASASGTPATPDAPRAATPAIPTPRPAAPGASKPWQRAA